MTDRWLEDLAVCFHHIPFRFACADCGRKDDPEPVLRATIVALEQEIARHHKDFQKWEDMADRACQRAERAEAERDELQNKIFALLAKD